MTMPATAAASPSPPRALVRGWRVLGDDPVRLLGASAVVLALDLALGVSVWRVALGAAPPLAIPLAFGARLLVGAPLELATIAWAAEAVDHRVRPSGDPLRALLPWAVERASGLVVGVIAASLPAVLAAGVLTSGAAPAALLLVAPVGLAFATGHAIGRAPWAMAPIRIVASGEPMFTALRASARAPARAHAARAVILLFGTVARLGGTLAGVAPALPAGPLVLVALLHRLYPEPGCAPSPSA